jgi:hypothetical protein
MNYARLPSWISIRATTMISDELSFWYCDQCEYRFRCGEFRYNCTICDDLDFCQQCMATIDPPHPHRMSKELAFGSAKWLEQTDGSMSNDIAAAVYMYSDRPCLGTRDVNKDDPSAYMDSYTWLTFETVGDRCKNFSNGLRQLIEPGAYLAICAQNRPEWIITDFACIYQGIVTVPIYCLFTDREVVHVINNTQVSLVVCDKPMLQRFVTLRNQCPSLRHIICMDPLTETVQGKRISFTRNDDIQLFFLQNEVS